MENLIGKLGEPTETPEDKAAQDQTKLGLKTAWLKQSDKGAKDMQKEKVKQGKKNQSTQPSQNSLL
jgi:hypothetical protein